MALVLYTPSLALAVGKSAVFLSRTCSMMHNKLFSKDRNVLNTACLYSTRLNILIGLTFGVHLFWLTK